MLKHGDFTTLARQYVNRPGYSKRLLRTLMHHVGFEPGKHRSADVGAGTGKLTEILSEIGMSGYAVEPNDAMRAEAIASGRSLSSYEWSKGYAEETGLPDDSVRWVTMASSFHWTDKPVALKEFHRILQDGGFFTALWNPRAIENNEQHMQIEEIIRFHVPDLKRVSSGSSAHMHGVEEDLLSTGHFGELIFMEAPHTVEMSKERYMNAWRSVNDIQVQAGPDRFELILSDIDRFIGDVDTIVVPYKTRAWTVRAQ